MTWNEFSIDFFVFKFAIHTILVVISHFQWNLSNTHTHTYSAVTVLYIGLSLHISSFIVVVVVGGGIDASFAHNFAVIKWNVSVARFNSPNLSEFCVVTFWMRLFHEWEFKIVKSAAEDAWTIDKKIKIKTYKRYIWHCRTLLGLCHFGTWRNGNQLVKKNKWIFLSYNFCLGRLQPSNNQCDDRKRHSFSLSLSLSRRCLKMDLLCVPVF